MKMNTNYLKQIFTFQFSKEIANGLPNATEAELSFIKLQSIRNAKTLAMYGCSQILSQLLNN